MSQKTQGITASQRNCHFWNILFVCPLPRWVEVSGRWVWSYYPQPIILAKIKLQQCIATTVSFLNCLVLKPKNSKYLFNETANIIDKFDLKQTPRLRWWQSPWLHILLGKLFKHGSSIFINERVLFCKYCNLQQPFLLKT